MTVTATAVDGANNTLGSVPVSISSDGGVLTTSAAVTDKNGQLTAALGIGGSQANRVITVTASSGSISKTATVQVVGTNIASVLSPPVITPGAPGEVQYRVVDQAGNPMAQQPVQIVATGLIPSQATGTTDVNGNYVFAYKAPASTGSYAISANIAGKTDTQSVQVQTASTVPAANLASITSASISANPIVVPVNLLDGTTNRSEIRALFQGAGNLAVPNVRVRFDMNGDPNSIGGKIATGDTVLYSDTNGVVTDGVHSGDAFEPDGWGHHQGLLWRHRRRCGVPQVPELEAREPHGDFSARQRDDRNQRTRRRQ